MKIYDLGISCLFAALGGWIFYATKDFAPYYRGAPGSGFWPRVIAVLMLCFSAAQAVVTLVRKKNTNQEEKPVFLFSSPGMRRIYLMFAVILALGFSVKWLGFVITALWFIPVVMIIMEERRLVQLILSSLAITFAIYAIFTWGLQMRLPKAFFM